MKLSILLLFLSINVFAGQDYLYYEGELYPVKPGSYCIEVGIEVVCFSEEEFLLRLDPVDLELNGIKRKALTIPQYEGAILKMVEFTHASKENEVMRRSLERKDLIIANYEEELAISRAIETTLEAERDTKVQEVKVLENRARLKKVEDWLERSGSIILIGLSGYGGYELGRYLNQ